MRRPRGVGRAHAPGFRRCARTIEYFNRIKMVVARASGTDLASSLKQNTFLTLGVRPAGGPCGTGGPGGPGTGGHGGPRDGGTRGGPGRGDTGGAGTGGHGAPRGAVLFIGGYTPQGGVPPSEQQST